jgi:hypothetical protein
MYPYYGENYLYNYLQKGVTGPFGTSPYEIMEVKDLPCRPCSKIGYHKCPEGHFRCMEDQPTDRIFRYF